MLAAVIILGLLWFFGDTKKGETLILLFLLTGILLGFLGVLSFE